MTTYEEISSPSYKIKMMLGVNVPMRDGVNISTDIYLPDVGTPVPAVLIRTPYNNNNESVVEECVYFASRGYAVVAQDVRGRWDSGGDWYPFINEAQDGFDSQEWVGSQPWCDGNLGTMGGSYLAMVQWQSAPLRSRYLKAMVPRVGYSNFYHNWVYTGGAFQLGFNLRWCAVQMHTRTNQVQYPWMPEDNNLRNLHWHLPLINMDEAAGRVNKVWKDWVNHPDYGDYWSNMRPTEEHYGDVAVPAYGLGGWYDVFLQSTLDNFVGVREQGISPGKENQKVLIGPWIHDTGDMGKSTVTGDLDFGDNARIDLYKEHLRWFDYWLKGIENGINGEPPVKVFVMGSNEWRYSKDWPIPGTNFTQFYLHSEGDANSLFGNGILNIEEPSSESPDNYSYDPEHPVMTLGGSTCCSEAQTPISMGPRDQQSVEWRPDVLVYTSSVLQEDLEVTGPIKMVLYASSDAKDTDFTAKLVDVSPEGTSINVAQGIIRARYRDSWDSPTLLEPGRVYEYKIDLWSSSNCFLKGHRVRLEISSSNFPQFDRNPNTGNPFGQDKEMQIAHQTVYHDKKYPSHIVLPVIPK